MGQVCTHVWVEKEGHKRRGLGKGKEEGDLAWNNSFCRHQWQSQKNDTMQVESTDSTAVTTVCLWALCIIQRTRAKQCHCMSDGSMLLSWEEKETGLRVYMHVWEQERVSMSSGDKQTIRGTHRVHAEL